MNNTTKPAAERLTKLARGIMGGKALNHAFGHFPSYLLVFGKFFLPRISEICSGKTRKFDGSLRAIPHRTDQCGICVTLLTTRNG